MYYYYYSNSNIISHFRSEIRKLESNTETNSGELITKIAVYDASLRTLDTRAMARDAIVKGNRSEDVNDGER